MGLIDDLQKAAKAVNEKVSGSAAIYTARLRLGAEEGPTYGNELFNVLTFIAERIGKEYVPVPLSKDGEPLEVGRRYYGKDGRAWTVLGFKPCAYDVVGMSDEGSLNTHMKGRWLSTEQPDTQERIDEDKRKSVSQYWGCGGAGCHQCPSKVDGLTPCERYGMDECEVAMGYDLALRQARLDGRA